MNSSSWNETTGPYILWFIDLNDTDQIWNSSTPVSTPLTVAPSTLTPSTQTPSTTTLNETTTADYTINATNFSNTIEVWNITTTVATQFRLEADEAIPCISKSEFWLNLLLFSLFSIGMILNCTLLLAIIREKLYRFSNHLCILNLVVADLLILLADIMAKLAEFAFPSYFPLSGIAYGQAVVASIASPASVITLAVMSCKRYHAIRSATIRKTYRRESNFGKIILSRHGLIICGIWIYAIGTITPIIHLLRNGYPNVRLLLFAGCIITYVIPLAIIGFNYIAIAQRLFTLADSMRVGAARNSAMRRSRAKALSRAKSILILAIIFLSCSFPRHFLIWMTYFFPVEVEQQKRFWEIWLQCSFYLYYLYPVLNPLSLYSTSEQFKLIFDRYLFRYNMRPAVIEESSSKEAAAKSTAPQSDTMFEVKQYDPSFLHVSASQSPYPSTDNSRLTPMPGQTPLTCSLLD